MTSAPTKIQDVLGQMQLLAPAGYALAFHIRYTTPTFLFQTYPQSWLRYYSENGLVMSDPTVHWGFANEGICRWSELASDDSAGILEKAAEHGIRFGATWAVDIDDSRSVGSLSRGDREFTDSECATILAAVSALHRTTAALENLPDHTTRALEEMDVMVTHPDS